MADMTMPGCAKEYFTPGDVLTDWVGVAHFVWKVLHTGYGKAGVLVTIRTTGSFLYSVWLVDQEGNIYRTAETADAAVAHGMFEARVIQALRAETHDGTTEIPEYKRHEPHRFDNGSIVPDGGE